MSTIKPRINITADREVRGALKQIAKRDGVPIATKAAELIAIGLNLEEDIALATMADERSGFSGEFVAHGQAWK